MRQPCIAPESSRTPSTRPLSCFLCRSEDIRRHWEGSDKKFQGPGRFTYVKCHGCRLVCLHPRPSAQELAQYYPDHVTVVRRDGEGTWLEQARQWLKQIVAEEWYGYRPQPNVIRASHFRLLRKVMGFPFRPFLRQVPRQRSGGRVLDIGCGSGGYLAFLTKLGWTCHGIEPGPKSRAYAQEVLGLTVHHGPLQSCRFPDSFFDVVTMWHVIEHLPDPLETLQEIRRILKPDGIIMLRTPNVDSLEARLFRGHWYGLDPPRHLFVLAPDTIRAMLERSGFVITRLSYQYHFVDCSRSLLYLLSECKSSRLYRLLARRIWYFEVALVICSPLRRILGHGGAMHVEARKASS